MGPAHSSSTAPRPAPGAYGSAQGPAPAPAAASTQGGNAYVAKTTGRNSAQQALTELSSHSLVSALVGMAEGHRDYVTRVTQERSAFASAAKWWVLY